MAQTLKHKRTKKRETVKIAVSLVTAYCLVGVLLAAVNYMTAPIIEKNVAQAAAALAEHNFAGAIVRKMFPDADSFEKAGEWVHLEQSLPYYKIIIRDKDAGYVIRSAGKGYSGIISVIIGVDTHGAVRNIEVLSQSETPGLGDGIMTDRFTKQFGGKDTAHLRVSTSGEEEIIQALSGATISSRAVTENAVKSAVLHLINAGLVGN